MENGNRDLFDAKVEQNHEEEKESAKKEIVDLQHRKNWIRKQLAEKGVLKRGGKNDSQHYSYFSEAQYKELFTKLFSESGIELIVSEADVCDVACNNKIRRVKLEITLVNIDNPQDKETVYSSGEGMDGGDKAIYKAKTGALKYFLANEFMVATGDDPEADNPEEEDTPKNESSKSEKGATDKQKQMIKSLYSEEEIETMKNRLGHDFTINEASTMIGKRMENK